MNFSDTDLIVLGSLLGFIIVCVIIIIVATKNHLHKTPFKPNFVRLSDGSLQMEFLEFGGLQKSRTERFLKEYYAGKSVSYEGNTYHIAEIREVGYTSVARVNDVKMVAYLEEING